jgi:spectinomycin phosphotransferase
MIRDDPGIDERLITTSLERWYGVCVSSLAFLPIGFDIDSAVYHIVASDEREYFLKLKFGPPNEAALEVPRLLADAGIPNILAPIPTLSSALRAPLNDVNGRTVTIFPLIHGRDAMTVGLDDAQWREFGRTLRAIHDRDGHGPISRSLRVERFDLPSATLVRQISGAVDTWCYVSEAAEGFANFWRENVGRIEDVVSRAEALGQSLHEVGFEQVLCHGDIHAANILVEEDGRIWLADWDDPLIAPRERDLLFVVGSRIAREVTPHEEMCFFEGYGEAAINADALRYFRYERIIEDIGQIGQSVLLTPGRSEAARAAEATLARSFFAPGGDIDRAERVERVRFPATVAQGACVQLPSGRFARQRRVVSA